MSDSVAFELISHDRARLIVTALDQTREEALGSLAVPARLYKHINDLDILNDCTAKILLLALKFLRRGHRR